MKQPIVGVFGGAFNFAEKKKVMENSTPHFFQDDQKLNQVLKKVQPQLIVTIGDDISEFPQISALPLRDRNKWLHFQSSQEMLDKLDQFTYCFVNHAIKYSNDSELITLFTTSYKSGKMIQRPLKTLLNQTYQHWEWIIFDDSDGDENWNNLLALKKVDPRIRVYRAEKNSGVIGHMKNLASSLARGGLIVELDHDDELTPRAMEYLMQASIDFPEAGFFHSDFCEIHEDGENFSYGDHFGLGYGSYRKEWNEDRSKWVNVVNCIPMNPATIRYLVACPNHFRAWRTSLFKEIGGWNPNFHVADDYEIMARSFLHTKFVKIHANCYFQYRNRGGNNHTFIRNREIQKLWRGISRWYNQKFNLRFKQLGVADPYVETWEKHGQWQKCWMNDKYETPLCETFKIRGRDPKKPLVGLAVVCFGPDDLQKSRVAIEMGLRQTYQELEITSVGNCIPEYEKMMDSILDIWNQGITVGENQVKLVDTERAKRDLRWWNTNTVSYFRACLNYILKTSSEGELVCYFDTEHLEKIDQNFVEAAVEKLLADPELQLVSLTGTKTCVHRRSLFAKYGYWGVRKDLYEIWKINEKNLDL